MFQPTRSLQARLRLTTKQVNGGYYKGNRTGSMGAHTPRGGYIIDYRKTRTYVCPELAAFKGFGLTPFVTKQMEPTKFVKEMPDGTLEDRKRVDGMEFLRQYRIENEEEYQQYTQPAETEEENTQTTQATPDVQETRT